MAYEATFLLNQLKNFPAQVVVEIFQYIPSEYLFEWVLALPPTHFLRQVIVETYFQHELHFVLCPTKRPHLCPPQVLDINFSDVDDFLRENPDISPSRIKFVVGKNFDLFQKLVQKYLFATIQLVEIEIESYNLTKDDLKFIIARLPNTVKLQFGGSKLTSGLQDIDQLRNLQTLIVLAHGITNWENVVLPPVNHLDISWNNYSSINTLKIPPSVTQIFFNQAGLNNHKFRELQFPPQLNTLMLTYNNISSINLNSLPSTLEVLDLSYNLIGSVEGNWPPNLKSLLLSNNLITNDTLQTLNNWPCFLKNLKLDNNPFDSLNNLHNLPDNLQYLNLSENNLKSLHTDQGYFEFPQFLEHLDLSNSSNWNYNLFYHPVTIKFPSTLQNLNLSECNLNDLSIFQFPPSLTKLSLSGNNIANLSNYPYWQKLVKLQELELYFNKIPSLEGWKIPPNLTALDIRLNQLSRLEQTPLFSHQHLRTIRLGQNQITGFDSTITVAKSLHFLSINDNSLTSLPSFLLGGSNLRELDLSDNIISSIEVGSEDGSSLTKLNLTGNKLLKGPSSQTMNEKVAAFYKDLESILHKNVKRKFNVNSVHSF